MSLPAAALKRKVDTEIGAKETKIISFISAIFSLLSTACLRYTKVILLSFYRIIEKISSFHNCIN